MPTDVSYYYKVQNRNSNATTEVIDHHYCNIDPRQLKFSGDNQYCPTDRCDKIKENTRVQQLAYIDACILFAIFIFDDEGFLKVD
jgi:hypothetical protein